MTPAPSDVIEERLRFRPDASAVRDEAGRLLLSRAEKRFAVGPLVAGLAPALEKLAGAGASEAALRLLVGGDDMAAAQLGLLVDRLQVRGWLERAVCVGGTPLATMRPLGHGDVGLQGPVGRLAVVQLSRFAFLHRDGVDLAVESPRSTAAVVLHEPRLAALVAWLATPRRIGDVEAEPDVCGLPVPAAAMVLTLLVAAGLVVPDGGGEECRLDLAQWSLTDLAFHARTRHGRAAGGYGATFPLEGRFPSLPERYPLRGLPVDLEAPPDLAAAAAADPPFTEVLERRRSVREQDAESPITAGQLGQLLFRAAGARDLGTTGPGDGHALAGAAGRPCPSGGGVYELELYPVVHRCEGLEPGLYHYDPVEHRLGLVAGPGPDVQSLLDDARRRALLRNPPQVLLVVTARFGRMMFKYEAISYATVLKNVGALYQTLYLVATAMGLGACALGGGDSDMFGRAAGLNYYAESSVGELAVGASPRSVPLP